MVDLKEFYEAQRHKVPCPSGQGSLSSDTCLVEMMQNIKNGESIRIIDVAIMRKKFQFLRNEITVDEYSSYLSLLSQTILNTDNKNLVASLIKLRSLSQLFPSLLKDFMTSSIFFELARRVINWFSKYNINFPLYKVRDSPFNLPHSQLLYRGVWRIPAPTKISATKC